MRKKELRVVMTFHTTTEAMAAEKQFQEREVPGRTIPVPREITAGCGLAWSAPADSRNLLLETVEKAEIQYEAWQELLL